MASEVSADIALINDEDVLRRMWADTEDFGRKKEIRARMYKLREQRLKDFYTTGDVVTEVTGRKHLTKTHADSISDQGFITMKTKEIRDSESPTRDFSQRALDQGNGYWKSRQENTYASGTETDGAQIEMKSNVKEGQGVIREGNKETEMAMASHNLHESMSKTDDNMSVKSEHHSHASKVVTSSRSGDIDDDNTNNKLTSSTQHQQQQQQQQSSQTKSEQQYTTSNTSSSSTKWSTTSSSTSKRIVSSSSQNYEIKSGEDVKSLRDISDRDELRAITDSDMTTNTSRTIHRDNISKHDDSNITEQNYATTNIRKNVTTSSTVHQENVHEDNREASASTVEKNVVDTRNDQYVRTNDSRDSCNTQEIRSEKHVVDQSERLYETNDNLQEKYLNESLVESRNLHDQKLDSADRYSKNTDTRSFITNERVRSTQDDRDRVVSERDDKEDNSVTTTKVTTTRTTKIQSEDVDDRSSRVDRLKRTDTEGSTTVTEQKIMNEIQKLDTYLSSQNTPGQTTPVSPHSVTDGANWTIVSSKEFVYQGEKPVPVQTDGQAPSTTVRPLPTYPKPSELGPDQPSTPIVPTTNQVSPKEEPSYTAQPREKIIKHPSSIDLPKEATDGQYVTTYQQSYNRISIDNSPSHDYFASTLRASPDRSTPSPTKRVPSRGSLDRSTPERRIRTTSKGSLDRSSPETKQRSTSKGSLDRSSPERKYKPSMNSRRTPEHERKISSSSYTIEKPKDTRRKSTDSPRNNAVKDTTKTRRKFSSTQTKIANKTRLSTPGASPSTSPTRKYQPKDITTTTTDSDSDVSHGTYKKTTTITSQDKHELVEVDRTTKASTQEITKPVEERPREANVPRSVQRDKSPEYSSEGSVSREIRENRIRDQQHDLSPDRSAFAPIKQIRTTVDERDETVNLITKERRLVDIEGDEMVGFPGEQHPTSSPTKEIPATKTIPEDQRQPRYSSTEQITTETDSRVQIKCDDIRETYNTNIETVRTKINQSSTEQLKEKSPSPDRKGGYRSPSRTSSLSPNPERAPVRNQQPMNNASTKTTTTIHRETKTFITEEKRQRSPEKQPGALRQKSPEKTPTGVRQRSPEKIPDTERRKTDIIRRKSKEITERQSRIPHPETSPTNNERRISKPETYRHKSPNDSPRKRVTTPVTSPERQSPSRRSDTSSRPSSLSPERPPSRRRPQATSPPKYRPEETTKITVIKQATDTKKMMKKTPGITETIRSPRKSNIPRETKSKAKAIPEKRPETTGTYRKPQTTGLKSPQKPRTPLSEKSIVTTVTKTTVTHQTSPQKTKLSPSQPARRIPTSPKKLISSPVTKTNITNRKENIPVQKPKTPTATISRTPKDIRHPSNQKENKRPTRPLPNQSKFTPKTIVKHTQEVTEFIDNEKIKEYSDIEDERPPEEFYVDIDDVAQPNQELPTTRKTTTRVNRAETVKTSILGTKLIKDKTPNQPIKTPNKSVPSKSKQILKESTIVNEKTITKMATLNDQTNQNRKHPIDSSEALSSPSSEDEGVDERPAREEKYTTIVRTEEEELIAKTKSSKQDLLQVIIQHPKSSRESSPGYPNTGIPPCSTSEDGESIPRYADFISEPEDVDTMDKRRREPLQPAPCTGQTVVQVTDLDDDEDQPEIRTSVAERVNEFLEAAKHNREVQETTTQHSQVDSSKKSVLKAKTLFENIAKNQTNVQVTTKPINIYETVQPEGLPKPTKVVHTTEHETVKVVEKVGRPTQPPIAITDIVRSNLKPSDSQEIVPSEQVVKPKLTPKTYDSFEVEEQQILEENQVKQTTSTSVKSTTTTLSQTPRVPGQQPTKEPRYQLVEQPEKKETKKPLERKPSGPTTSISSRKDFFERKVHNVDKPRTPVKDAPVRSRPQKEHPKTSRPTKSTGEPEGTHDSLTTTKTESYMKSTLASSVRSQTPEKQPKDRRDSKPDVLHREPLRHESSPTRDSESPRRTSPTRRTSKPEEIVRKPSKSEETPRRTSKDEPHRTIQQKPKERSQSPLKPDERMKSPSKVIEVTRIVQKTLEGDLKKSTKPTEDIHPSTRRTSKPETHEETRPRSPVKGKDINTVFKQTEQTVEVTREGGKFGVTLRKTPSSTKVTNVTTKTTPKKTTDIPDIEDIFDLDILEDLLLKAVGYDERRRIRAQIRIVKKQLEEEYNTPGRTATVTTTTTTTYTSLPSLKDIKTQSTKFTKSEQMASSVHAEERTTKVINDDLIRKQQVRTSPERKPSRQSPEKQIIKSSSPERKSPERKYDTRKIETTTTTTTYRKDSLPRGEKSPERKVPDRISPEKQLPRSPERKSSLKQEIKQSKQTTEKTTTERRTSASSTGADRKPVRRDATDACVVPSQQVNRPQRDSKADISYETTTSTAVKSQTFRQVTSSTTKETCPTDSITSSYGVGPTDEHGKPLFGLRALRRTNTNKTLGEDEVAEEQQVTTTTIVAEDEQQVDEVYDSNGRPLFGLKALQATTEELDTNMPAQTAQLRELVEKHQQYARESSAKEIKPVQKPKAKLRDSFILTTDEEHSTTNTSQQQQVDETTRGLSLKSIIKKHEDISTSGGAKVESQMESRRTVVTSHSTVSSDGKITHKKNVVHGEISSKNGEAPIGKITQKTYSYQSPDEKQSLPTIKSTTKVSTIGTQRRLSGPKIEEIKDDTTIRATLTDDIGRRYSKEYTVDDSCEDFVERRRSQDVKDEEQLSSTKTVSSILKTIKDDSWNSGAATTVVRRTSGSKLLTDFQPNDSVNTMVTKTTTTTTRAVVDDNKDDNKRALGGRGDSVKALQHKFQQATVSSSLKQTNVERTDSKNKLQEVETRELIRSSPVVTSQVKTLEDSQTVRTTPNGAVITKTTTVTKGPSQQVTTTKVTEVSTKTGPTSFLDDKTKVTGVQDILNRMRNADLVSESGDTSEDAEARALLNKFLGASVILQGMEEGMRSTRQQSTEPPSSAALVNQAEKQRVKEATVRTQDYNVDEICDEKQLRILLEACSDYEGRRKIRARLRTIMADHKGGIDSNELATTKDASHATKTEVHTRTVTSTARLTKANSVQSPFAKFRQMERQNSAPSSGRGAPNFVSEPKKVMSSVSNVKEHLLNWVQAQTRAYKNVQVENFSTSWSDGLAFCALIHHFCPNAFDYNTLSAENRRYNFELAFRVAEDEDIYPLLDVEDMVTMRKPDWKCVFTYVQSVYRRFHNSPDALPANPYV